MKKVLAAVSLVLTMSSVAQAGILLEPYLGYETGAIEAEFISLPGTTLTNKSSGTAMGLRLGYQFLLPWVALDYTTASGKYDKASLGTDGNYSKSALGAVVGVDLPLIRGWLGYGFSNSMTAKPSTGGDTTFKGSYTKVGVGFGFIPFVSLNAEYQINKFDKYDSNGIETKVSDTYNKFDYNTVLVSVSVPFDL